MMVSSHAMTGRVGTLDTCPVCLVIYTVRSGVQKYCCSDCGNCANHSAGDMDLARKLLARRIANRKVDKPKPVRMVQASHGVLMCPANCGRRHDVGQKFCKCGWAATT